MKDGAWLMDDDQAALDLEGGKVHKDIQALIDGEKMKVTKNLQHWLFEKNKMHQPSSDQIHVLVVIPSPSVGSKRPIGDEMASIVKRLRQLESESAAIKLALTAVMPKTLTKLTPLSVHEDEFRLDNLSITLQSDDPIVMTPTLHKFWEGFGRFPQFISFGWRK
ncbi:CRN-like protein [Plasmopara halstedii]|uniref:CRN-like protein n=1 Tax=Plasmopara halstedii TaxID=4781 RepID=A0A0P1AQF6_PLAHL|nr:CRN-like protein [Plasmopara halstedii]CEG43424.1 CRN-like protein [Plasmopara halstedii]|eukprot:XP_024579793.1 CRN-like protein [Plasmopara halstedii]